MLESLIERQNSSSTSETGPAGAAGVFGASAEGSADRVEIDRADQVGVTPGKLVLVGLFIDLGADLGHGLLNLDAGSGDIGHQRPGERAVGAGFTVERGLAGAGSECDQGAFAGLHLGKAGLYRNAAGRLCAADFGGERVVAAGIEEHQLDLGVRHGLVEREVDIDGGAQLDVHFGFEVGIDRQQVVGAIHGDAVAGIEEHRDIGAFGPLAEVEQLFGHLVAGKVGAFDDVETDIAQNLGDRLGVDRRVRKRRYIPIGAVADHEGDTLVGKRRVGADEKCCGCHCCDQEAHGPFSLN